MKKTLQYIAALMISLGLLAGLYLLLWIGYILGFQM